MGKAKQERELSLLARVDEATIKRSIARMNELSRGFNAAADAETRLDRATVRSEATLGELSNETRQNVSAIRQRIAATKLDIQAQQDYLAITKKETSAIEQQTHAQDKLNRERKEGRGSGGVSAAERAGSISSFTGSISALAGGGSQFGGAFNIVSDITQVAEYLPRLKEALTGIKAGGQAAEIGILATSTSLKGLAITLGPLAIGAAVVGAGLFLINTELKKGEKTAIDAAAAERSLAELRVRGSREAIDAALEEARFEQAVAKEQIRLADDRLRAIAGEGDGVSLAEFREIEKTQKAIDGYNKVITDQQVIIGAVTDLQSEYNGVLITAAEVTDRVIGILKERGRIEAEAQRLAETGTRAQLDQRIEAIKQERDLIAAQIEQLEPFAKVNAEVAAEIERLREREAALAAETARLKEVSLPLIAAREKEARTIEAQKQSLEKANTLRDARLAFDEGIKTLDAKTAQERLKIADQANKDLLRIETKRLEQIAGLEQDFQRADLKASTKLETDIAKIESDSREQEIDIRKESASRIEDLETRAARERQRILEDYNDSALDAIQNRDAVALDAAQRTRNKALRDNKRQLDDSVKEEKKALKERLEEAKKSNRDRINDLRQSYAQERRDRLEALQLRIADINANAAQERATVAARLAEQLTALDAHYRDELQKLKDALGGLLREYNIYYGNLQTTTQAELDLLALRWEDYFRRIGQATPTSSGGGGGGVGPPPELAAKGIRGFRNGSLIVGERGPELLSVRNGAVDVLSNTQTRSAFSGMAQAVRGGSNTSYTSNNVMVGRGAFQANLSGGDPTRMVRELERRLASNMPRIIIDVLRRGLKD